MIAQKPKPQGNRQAEYMLERVGETVLQRLRLDLPGYETGEEPLDFTIETDMSSYPTSTILEFKNTAAVNDAYGKLPSEQQAELFSGLQSAVRAILLRAEPYNKLAERDVDAYVFADQTAVEIGVANYRRGDSFFLPTARAINWQQAELLVGDLRRPTEINLYRLGYQETTLTSDTTFYRHYDPAMPLVGYGYTDGLYYVSIFNTGKIPTVLTLLEPEQLVDLRQARTMQYQLVAQEPSVVYQQSKDTRYPATLLGQAISQFGIALTDANARRLLNGQKTTVVATSKGTSGKLYVLNTPDNGPQLILQNVQPELRMQESYLGHVFTERDRQNLQKYGDMGRVVELTDRQTHQKFAAYIGVDKETRTLTVLRVDQIRPKIERMAHLKGVPLNEQQKQRLIAGNAVRLDNMTSKAGTTFSALVRVSAASRGLRFDPIPGVQSRRKASTGEAGSRQQSSPVKHTVRQQ
jgi:hypothetical protein